ncbi:hypothetical protein JTB14_022727 [Gonioctena quinquepunctata]|nr:hypothetical protein JTB14_022727 [Gonioctena quinquepunctata]
MNFNTSYSSLYENEVSIAVLPFLLSIFLSLSFRKGQIILSGTTEDEHGGGSTSAAEVDGCGSSSVAEIAGSGLNGAEEDNACAATSTPDVYGCAELRISW